MGSSRRLIALAAALGLAVSGALVAGPSPAAPAAPEERGAPGVWTKVTSGDVRNTAEPGLFRTADGVLHVVYLRHHPSTESLAYTTIGSTGAVTGSGVAVAGWAALPEDPKVVGVPGGGMRLVFGGIHDVLPGDPYGGGQMYSALSDADGSSWTLEPGALTESGSAVTSYGTGATTLADGTPVVSFPLNNTVTWNAGGTDSTFDFGTCCVYDTTLARDGDEVWMSFAANGSTAAKAGQFVRQLLPTTGPVAKVPRSSEGPDVITPAQATAFVARPGGGLYLAYCIGYPTCDAVGLWRVGSGQPVIVPGSRGARDIALSTGPGGRLWVAWTTYDVVKVVHTGTTGTRFGAVRTIKPPAAVDALYGVSLAGSDGSADVLINSGTALWHQQVLPGLTLKAAPKRWRHGTQQRVTFTVTDAGDQVGGARVTALGESCTTAGTGRCSITFAASRSTRFVATARHAGYGAGTVRLKVT
ncbi:MAG TPA: hypothetical protein VD864_00960 [Nocardioides sp.]|nr:hypothetical protein [Nocardioides sp.]